MVKSQVTVKTEIFLTFSLCSGGGVVCKVIFMSNPTFHNVKILPAILLK